MNSTSTHIHVCVHLCVYVCVFLHICRMDENLPEMSVVTGNVLVDSHGQHQVLDDDRTYSTSDDMQQEIVVVSGNPAYNAIFECSRKLTKDDDHAYSNTELSQKQESVTHRLQTHGVVPRRKAVSAK